MPYKCSLVRRELSTSVKYVRPVRISTTPYDVAETIFEEDPNGQPVCASLPPLPPGTTPSTRSRIIAAASGGPTPAASSNNVNNSAQSNNNTSSVSKSAQQQQEGQPIDLTKTQHASLQLPNNMGTISIVIESLKI